MNKKTSELRVNNNTPFQAITGLRANTKYYFQAIIKDNNGTVDRGIVRSFRTLSSNRVAVNGQCSS
jgi:cephalosporin-C deacetylase-like acetyl esterase